MNWKVTAVLGVVLCVLLGVHWGLKRHRTQVKEVEQQAKQIHQIEQTDIAELRLAVKGEKEVVGRKEVDEWSLVAPVEARVDTTAFDRILRDFAGATKLRTVDESPSDLEMYGLGEPAIEVGVKTAVDSETEYTLLIGSQNPTKSYYFAKRADQPAVFLVNTWLKTGFEKKLKDLRNKKIVDAEKTAVSMIEVARGESVIKLEKDDGTWQIREPVEVLADSAAVTSLLDEIAAAQVQEFVSDEPGDLAEYGLAEPAVRLTVYTGDEKAGQTLLFGAGNEENTGVYAKRDVAGNVVLMKKTLIEAVPETVDDIRNRSLVLATAHDVKKFEYSSAEGSFTLELDDDNVWYIDQPQRMKADSIAVNALFTDLGGIQAESFMAEAKPEHGFDSPRVKLAMWFAAEDESNGPRRVTALIGAENPDDTSLSYAMSEEGMPVTVSIDKDTMDKLEKTLFDFRDKVLVDFRKDDVERLEATYLDGALTVAREDGAWSVVDPADIELRDPGMVDNLTWTIGYLKMSKVVEDVTPDDTAQYGLDDPLASFTIHMKDDTVIGPFLIGDESNTDAANFYAVHAQTPGLYLVEQQVVADIRSRLNEILGKMLKDVTAATRDRQTERIAAGQKAAAAEAAATAETGETESPAGDSS